MLTLIRIGLGRRSGRARGEERVSRGGYRGAGFAGFRPPGVPCVRGVRVWGLRAGTFGRSPAGRGGKRTRFLPSRPLKVSCRSLSSCFSAVTTGGGTRSLTRYQPRPGWRDWKGPEGEGRDDYSSAGFRSRYRPFGATNAKTSTAGHLKIWS